MCNSGKSTIKIHIGKNSLSHSKTFTYVLLTKHYLDKEDPWEGILADTAFAAQSTYHTML